MSELVKYNEACRAIAAAKNTDEILQIRDLSDRMRAASVIARNKTLEIDAAEIRIRAERRLGEIIEQQKATEGMNAGGRPEKTPTTSEVVSRTPPPTLAEAGIDYKLSSRAQKIAAVPQDQFENILSGWRDRVSAENERVTVDLLREGEKHNHRAQGTGENEWYTPGKYILLARRVLGSIDLDPATSEFAQRQVAAKEFFTVDDNSLGREWRGNVWLNPPYAQPAISHFVEKLVSEVESERVDQAIMLTHNYTDTAWFHRAEERAAAICFTRGRVSFESPNGDRAMPTQGQAFFYYGSNVDKFQQSFQEVGFIR